MEANDVSTELGSQELRIGATVGFGGCIADYRRRWSELIRTDRFFTVVWNNFVCSREEHFWTGRGEE